MIYRVTTLLAEQQSFRAQPEQHVFVQSLLIVQSIWPLAMIKALLQVLRSAQNVGQSCGCVVLTVHGVARAQVRLTSSVPLCLCHMLQCGQACVPDSKDFGVQSRLTPPLSWHLTSCRS